MSEASLTLDILTALDAVVLEWQPEGWLNLLTPTPEWFTALYPETANRSHNYIAANISPFLENFLFDAETVWAAGGQEKSASEFWTENSASGAEYHLRALAFTVNSRKLILFSEVGAVFADRQAILQRAREGALHIHALQRAEQKLRESETALARARDLAVQTARLKSDFLANMSHEIRTPLNGVIGLADLMLDTPLNAEQRGYANTIQSSAETLLRIVNDILDFSKIEAGKLTLESIDFDPRALTEGVVTLFQQQAHVKKLRLSAKCQADVPPAARGDAVRVRQILLNLAGNALKFTAQGQVELCLELSGADGDGVTLRWAVKDTGPGLAEEAQARLFQPFTQADSSISRQHGGTGLGLAICKQLATLMGGEIGVESQPGQGATFWFTARLEHSELTAAQAQMLGDLETGAGLLLPETGENHLPALVLEDAETSPRDLPPARILLTEDNLVNQRVAQKHLAYLGFQADLANDGREALAALARQKYDLIFMDCQMAGMDGFTATAEIRRREGDNRRTPIVAMTAHALPGDRERCLAAGMDDYLSKPLRRTDFAAMLERWLPAASALAEAEFSLDVMEQAIGWTQKDDPVMFAEIVTLFCRAGEERLENLRAAIEQQEAATIKSLGHAFRGSCSSLGIRRLEQLCQALEDCAASPVQTKALLGELEHEFSRVKAILASDGYR
jgi:signal transduction histidine kinase/CheY-like chemotaxis protein